MKINLAENLLRFAPKNLDAKTVEKLQQLAEQEAVSPTTTGGTYKTDPLYNSFYEKLGDRAKRYWDGTQKGAAGEIMTDADRDKLFATFKQKIAEKERITGNDANKVLKSVEAVVIGSTQGETAKAITSPATPKKIEPVVLSAAYPDPSVSSPQLQNFFLGDDTIEVSPEAKNGFVDMIESIKAQIPAGSTITEVLVWAKSSTSKVPSTYKGQGNVVLVQDRYTAATTALAEVAKQQLPEFSGNVTIVPAKPEYIRPNLGPEWTEDDRIKRFPLNKRKKTLKNGQPNPEFDPKVLAAYEAKYGAYKGSAGYIQIKVSSTETETKTTPPEPEVKVTQNWYLRLNTKSSPDWNLKLPKFWKSKGGGGIIWNGGAPTKCWFN